MWRAHTPYNIYINEDDRMIQRSENQRSANLFWLILLISIEDPRILFASSYSVDGPLVLFFSGTFVFRRQISYYPQNRYTPTLSVSSVSSPHHQLESLETWEFLAKKDVCSYCSNRSFIVLGICFS